MEDPSTKEMNPQTAQALNGSTDSDLWALLRSGYAVIAVSGEVLSDEATPAFDAGEQPAILAALADQVTTQGQSRELVIIGDILQAEHGILQVIPATSSMVGKLSVGVHLSGPKSDGSRSLRVHLRFDHGLTSRTAESEVNLASATGEQGRFSAFGDAVKAALVVGFSRLEQDEGPGLLPF